MLTPYPRITRKRCRVKPGITGLWQVMDRENDTSVLSMVEYDFDYVDNLSFALDMWILLKTVPVLFCVNKVH
jgi:lipopolysaccharide/colanic/teichoic acid biosynthesis glycosyltransferase